MTNLSQPITKAFEPNEAWANYNVDISTVITPQQAKEYINDQTNPEKYRDALKEVLERYLTADSKQPGRIIITVSRFGHCGLWMD